MKEREKYLAQKEIEREERKKKHEDQKQHRQIQKLKREHQTADVYSVKHGETTLVFKKKGEGETPVESNAATTEIEQTTPAVQTAPISKFKHVAKAIQGTAGMIWKAKKKGDTTES